MAAQGAVCNRVPLQNIEPGSVTTQDGVDVVAVTLTQAPARVHHANEARFTPEQFTSTAPRKA